MSLLTYELTYLQYFNTSLLIRMADTRLQLKDDSRQS